MSCTYSVAEIMIALLLLACISISICRSPACIVFTKAAPHWDGPFDSRCSAHFGPFWRAVLPGHRLDRNFQTKWSGFPACVLQLQLEFESRRSD
uniref:Putative secreted protein n=1 Tax=Anopheles darlingi TaxID=43151 RepID=A0A2M4D4W1_ANODA